MGKTSLNLRDTIKAIVRRHLLEEGGIAMGQCLTAVGWVGGTLPELYEKDGMIELSMADVANGGFAVGAALTGIRPIYVIRYQGFNWFNAPIIINYAAKSKEIWGVPCPLFVRSIAMEGGIGPVAGSSHHSLYYRMPGIKIVSPMTPREYSSVYDSFMNDDDVYYVSEHRKSFDNKDDLSDVIVHQPQICLFPISITRFAALEAAKVLKEMGYRVCVYNILWLKPLGISNEAIRDLKISGRGIVLDDDYVDGVAKSIAFDLASQTGSKLSVMGLEDRTAGFHPNVDNLPPDSQKIVERVVEILTQKGAY